MPAWINKYKSLYQWMLVPMVVMQLGIFEDYWGDFADNAWPVHIHYLTGTIWYLYLIIQPYFATHNQIAKHRTNGIIGMFIAGAVCITAMSMLNRDIETTQIALEMPERFGPFQPWFFFGVIVVEMVMIVAFGFAVIKGILHRKAVEDHAWWLISTVFIIMMPALARGIGNVYNRIYIEDWPNINVMIAIYYSQGLIIAMLLLGAWKYGKLKHPATFLALAVNLFVLFLEPIGKWETLQLFLKAVIKG